MNYFRVRRHAQMTSLFAQSHARTILDIGGTMDYWRTYGTPPGAHVTLLNRATSPVDSGFVSVAGDACDLSCFDCGEFDLAFSSSTIEHVGSWQRQARMASEIRRVGRVYFVQAPYRHFPLEVHFHIPLFQYLPRSMQKAWIMARYHGAIQDRKLRGLERLRLPTLRDFRSWFPDATVQRERVGPLTKSLIAYRGAS